MTKDIIITVVGNQDQDNEVTLMTQGSYYYKDNKHYVFYEEQAEADSETVKNRICFDSTVFEMSKKGAVNSLMTFDADNITLTTYHTPYGPLQLEIITNHYEMREKENVMEMDIYYALSFGDRDSRDCHVYVKVEAQKHHEQSDRLRRRRL